MQDIVTVWRGSYRCAGERPLLIKRVLMLSKILSRSLGRAGVLDHISTSLRCHCSCFWCEGVNQNTKHVHRLLGWNRVLQADFHWILFVGRREYRIRLGGKQAWIWQHLASHAHPCWQSEFVLIRMQEPEIASFENLALPTAGCLTSFDYTHSIAYGPR